MEASELPVEEAKFFRYRGEGAANIVLSYHGPNIQFAGKVLRIRKISTVSESTATHKDALGTTEPTGSAVNVDKSGLQATVSLASDSAGDSSLPEHEPRGPLLPTSEAGNSILLSPSSVPGETESGEGREQVPAGPAVTASASAEQPILNAEEQEVWKEWPEVAGAQTSADLVHAFTKLVMQPLLGREFVDPGTPVLLSESFLEIVWQNISLDRPAWRAQRGQLALVKGRATLISDHSLFPFPPETGGSESLQPTICVEIKPKCGFLPTSSAIGPDNAVKRQVSRFELHQHLKLSRGEVAGLSKYNPLHLFSGDRQRVESAIAALFETPQNNLRVFKNGRQVLGVHSVREEERNADCRGGAAASSSSSASPSATPGTREALEEELEGFFSCPNGERVNLLQTLLADAFFESRVLERLLSAHKLDTADIEGAIHAYRRMRSTDCDGPELGDAPDQREECRKVVQDFLIAATAKDCGLMATFRPKRAESRVESPGAQPLTFRTLQLSHSQERFEFKVSFVDLDMKPVKKMPSYLKLDQEIVAHYRSLTQPQ